jgi:hypothetical protein
MHVFDEWPILSDEPNGSLVIKNLKIVKVDHNRDLSGRIVARTAIGDFDNMLKTLHQFFVAYVFPYAIKALRARDSKRSVARPRNRIVYFTRNLA